MTGFYGTMDKVSAAIRATTSCQNAAELATACAMGASGDVTLASAAEHKCGLDFWNKLSAQEKKIYNHIQSKYNDKYKNKDGTMYISFNAFCRLDVAKLYSELYTPGD